MAANMSQLYTGMNYGRPALGGTAPSTPSSAISVTGAASAQSTGAPLGMVLLAAIGGLVLLYFSTRSIQGIR